MLLVGAADQQHHKLSFFRRACPRTPGVRQESSRGLYKAGDFVKSLGYACQGLDDFAYHRVFY